MNGVEAVQTNGDQNGDSCQQSKLFPCANTCFIHTGNVSHWSSLKRTTTQSPANELHDSLLKTLNSWFNERDGKSELKCKRAICCLTPKTLEKVPEDERKLNKVTVKIFLQKPDPSYIREAIMQAMCELGISYVDTVFLALPIDMDTDVAEFAKMIKPCWEEMEKLIDTGISHSLASCDLDKQKLEQLVSVARIRPEVNQVNLTSCCHMPEDLVAYAKETEVMLHTHGDPQILLTEETLQDVIKSVSPADSHDWYAKWVLRYSVVIKCRGVIKNKGYIASCEREQCSSPRDR